jgi:hypothetical protein
MISPKSAFSQHIEWADIFITPDPATPNTIPIGGFLGGDGDVTSGANDWISWSVGNCVPWSGTQTDNLVISTCVGDFMNPADWKARMVITKEGNVGIGTTTPGDYRLKVYKKATIFPRATPLYNTQIYTHRVSYTGDVYNLWAESYVQPMDGTTDTKKNYAIYSHAHTQSNAGVDNYGIYAKASGGYTPTKKNYAIYAEASGGNTNYAGYFVGDRVYISGNVGIGTTEPQHKLDVEGYVQAHGYYTGDIVFQKDGNKLWRMFEDEKGLYLENLSTGEVYRFVLEKVKK